NGRIKGRGFEMRPLVYLNGYRCQRKTARKCWPVWLLTARMGCHEEMIMPKKHPPTGFAGRLKELRQAAGLTQAELAKRVGLNQFSIAKFEQGVQEPTWPTALAIAEALDVQVGVFVVRTPGKARKAIKQRERRNRAK